MKKIKLLSLLLIMTIFAGMLSVPALAVDAPVTSAQSVLLIDVDTGEILFQKNASSTFSPGGLTALMTALVTGDSLSRQDVRTDDVVTITDNCVYNLTDSSVRMGLLTGENLTVEQLLYMTVLSSAEDAANALAEHISGSCDAFAAAMNSRAAELGCTDTSFVNAGGTYAEGQYTCARDLGLIARELFQNAIVMPAFQTVSYTVPATELAGDRALSSPNALLIDGDGRRYELSYAGKYAVTDLGPSLMAAATYNELDVIAVVIGCPDGVDVFTEAKNLFDWTFANYGYRTLVSSTDVLESIPVDMGNPGTVGVRTSDNIRVVLPNDREPTDVSYDIVYQHDTEGVALQAPINVGEYLGDVTVYMAGQPVGTSRLVAATAVDISRLDYLRSQLEVLLANPSVRQIITILLGALGLYLLLVLVYLIQRFVHLHSLRKARRERAKARAQQELEWLELPAGQRGQFAVTEPEEPMEFQQEAPADDPEEEPYIEPDAAPEDEAPEEEPEFVQEETPEDESEYVPEDEAPVDEPEYVPEEEAPEEEPEYVPEEEAPEDELEYVPEDEVSEEEPEYVPEDEAPEDELEYVPEDEVPEEEPEYVPEDEVPEDEPEYVPEDEVPEDEPEYADDGEDLDDEDYIDDEDDDGYYEDESGYADEQEDDGYYGDEDDGPGEPPETPKRHWWKR